MLVLQQICNKSKLSSTLQGRNMFQYKEQFLRQTRTLCNAKEGKHVYPLHCMCGVQRILRALIRKKKWDSTYILKRVECKEELAGHGGRCVYIYINIYIKKESPMCSRVWAIAERSPRCPAQTELGHQRTPSWTGTGLQRPIYNPLLHCTLVHFHWMMHGTHIWYTSIILLRLVTWAFECDPKYHVFAFYHNAAFFPSQQD